MVQKSKLLVCIIQILSALRNFGLPWKKKRVASQIPDFAKTDSIRDAQTIENHSPNQPAAFVHIQVTSNNDKL